MKARNKKPLSWYVIWSLMTAVALAILTGFILSLPIWQVQYVKVKGNLYLTDEKTLKIANIPVGENIFMIDPEEIKSRFSNIIQIKDIIIRRKLPKTILIEIKERCPFAIVVIGNTTCLVDNDGYIIARNDIASSIYKIDIAKYPVVRGINKASIEKGSRLGPSDRSFMNSVIDILSKFMDTGTIQIDMSNREDIKMFIEDIVKVRIGGTKDIRKKIRTVMALIEPIRGKWEKIVYVDVRVPDNPVIMFK